MLHVTLLGEQAITDERTGSARMRSSRTVALVAFLALHAGSPQPRQRIAGLFWPDSTDAQALTNLRRELHNLRQILGDQPVLLVTPRDLCWRDSELTRVDLRAFDTERRAALAAAAAGDSEGILAHAARAVAQYGGELLPGMYDDWLLDARAELERQCVNLCDLLGETRASRGDLTGAADAARRRIQLQPLEEVGYRTLMLLQADLGDRAGAVSTYHHCASVLERELSVVPGPATRQVLERLMAHVDPAGTEPPATGPAGGRSGFAAARLVGRSAELGLLQELWRAAAAGRPGFAMVYGGAGVGKTRLVAEVADLARLQGRSGGQCSALRNIGSAGAGTGRRLGAKPGRPVSDGDAGSGLARRGRQAGAVRRPRAARGRIQGHGRRLAAPSLLRGPRAGAAGRRPADAAGSGQYAMVRPGNPGLPHILPGTVGPRSDTRSRDAARRQP
jgi:DNA-binding SARP family transcriptional activator